MTVSKPEPESPSAAGGRSPLPHTVLALKRAERAACCAPFQLPLFTTMRVEGVSIRAIAGAAGLEHQYTRQELSELSAETALLWLVQVGILRREVDGQGLTDSFRLTPLGRQLVQRWETQGQIPKPSGLDFFYNAIARWVRLPGWLH